MGNLPPRSSFARAADITQPERGSGKFCFVSALRNADAKRQMVEMGVNPLP
jgi:hypothetical protein